MDTLTRPPGTCTASVELSATPEAVRVAQLYVENVLTGWSLPVDFVFTAKQLTLKLATNAITHGSGGGWTFTIEVRSFGSCVGVEVIDGGEAAA
jgi:hypothetical protein